MHSSALARSSSTCSCSSSSAAAAAAATAFGKNFWGTKGDQKCILFLSKEEEDAEEKRRAARAMMPTAERRDRAIMTEENTSSLPSIYKSEDRKEQQVLDALKNHRPRFWRELIVNCGLVKVLKISDDGKDVALVLELTTPACPVKDGIQQTLERVRETIGVGR